MADKIQIDVLTLDSVQCAACGYMMESLAAMPADIQDMIEYQEWSIKNKTGIAKFMELKGKVLPTICIGLTCSRTTAATPLPASQ